MPPPSLMFFLRIPRHGRRRFRIRTIRHIHIRRRRGHHSRRGVGGRIENAVLFFMIPAERPPKTLPPRKSYRPSGYRATPISVSREIEGKSPRDPASLWLRFSKIEGLSAFLSNFFGCDSGVLPRPYADLSTIFSGAKRVISRKISI